MPDEKTNGNGQPPKLRLTLNKSGNGDTPAKMPAKSDTSRVDLADTEPAHLDASTAAEPLNVRDVLKAKPVAASPATVQMAPRASPKAETSRISLHESQQLSPGEKIPQAKSATSRVTPAASPPVTTVISVPTAKTATSRVSLHETQPVAPGEKVPQAKEATSRISLTDSRRVSPEQEAEIGKSSTARLDLTGMVGTDQKPVGGAVGAGAPKLDALTADAQKNRTARISIEGPANIPTGGAVAQTGKIADSAAALGVSVPANQPPKTVRLQRPAAPRTVVLKRPEATPGRPAASTSAPTVSSSAAMPTVARGAAPTMAPAAPEGGPKTVVLRKPEAGAPAEPEKGATSRITVPEGTLEATPPTQRKTIRIKRTGGEGAAPGAAPKTLVLARPVKTEEVGEAEEAEKKAVELEQALGVPSQEPGVVFLILSIAALLVVGTLIYVLAAQAMPQWALNWPGKIV